MTTEPLFFCWPGGVLNVNAVISATIGTDNGEPAVYVHLDGAFKSYVVRGEGPVGEFMLMCARYHASESRPGPWALGTLGKPEQQERAEIAEVKTDTVSIEGGQP